MNNGKKECQVIVVNPKRCLNCETCMEICSLIHGSEYIPLTKRIIGSRKRVEIEWAISCDLCLEMKDEFIDPELGKVPQCVDKCPNFAIFISRLEPYGDESRMKTVKRIFNQPIIKTEKDMYDGCI